MTFWGLLCFSSQYISPIYQSDSGLWLILLILSSNGFCNAIAEVLSIFHLLRNGIFFVCKSNFFSLTTSWRVTTLELFSKHCFPGEFSSFDLFRKLCIIKDFFPQKFQIQCLVPLHIFYHYPTCLFSSFNSILKKEVLGIKISKQGT